MNVIEALVMFVFSVVVLIGISWFYPQFPVHCTLDPIVVGCSVVYSPTPTHLYRASHGSWVFARFANQPHIDVLNALCSEADKGSNVLVFVSQDLNEIAATLKSCGVRVKVSDVGINEIGSDQGYVSYYRGYGIYTDCNSVITAYHDKFMGEWERT